MDFSKALERIKQGDYISREGWNGKGQYIFLVNPDTDRCRAYISIKTVANDFIPWVPSHSDLLASDWQVFNEQLDEF